MHAQRFGETVDVQQRDVALTTLDAAQVAARQPALQSKAFLGESFGLTDVPPILSSASVWSPIPYPEEIGREETFY